MEFHLRYVKFEVLVNYPGSRGSRPSRRPLWPGGLQADREAGGAVPIPGPRNRVWVVPEPEARPPASPRMGPGSQGGQAWRMWTCAWSILSQGGLQGLDPLHQVASALPDRQHITTLGPQLPRLGDRSSVSTPFFTIK